MSTKKVATKAVTAKPAVVDTSVAYAQDVATGALYEGVVSPEVIAAAKNGPVLAEIKTQRDEYGTAVTNIWLPAPEIAPGTPIPGEYKTVTVVKVG